MEKLGYSSDEFIDGLKKVYGDQSPSRTQVFEWIKRFKEGKEELKDDPRSGRPSKDTAFYRESWQRRMQKCLDMKGSYVKK
ncbi:Protein GVQW3 [Anthophora plagiata]